MRKVKRTKEPTLKQMQNMSLNLEDKFNKPSLIHLYVWGKSRYESVYFSLYVEDTYNNKAWTWSALQDNYFTVMEEEEK